MAMDHTQEMVALKKVYADMILNTTKEAAVRVMAAEIKAQKYEKDLVSTKEEAVRMLLRLKQMIDTQKKEAEITSLNGQMRINELEAQLDEAEGVIIDLRAKLSYVEDKLERVKDKYKRSLAHKEVVYPPNHSKTPMVEQSYFAVPYSFSECGPTSVVSEVQVSLPKPSILVHECITTQNNISCTKFRSDPCPVNGVSSNNTESKEPELDNNDCRQRVEGGETVTLKPITCGHECITSLKEISLSTPVFASGTTDSKEPELQNNGCSQRVQGSEAISLLKPSILVHKSKTLPKEISRSSSGCVLDSVHRGSASATTESNDPCKKEYSSQRSLCLPADKLHTAQETKSFSKRGQKTKKKKRNGKTKSLSCLRTEKSGGRDSFVRQAVFHNDITDKDQPVKVHMFPRRTIRYGRLKTASCKRRSARIVMHQQTSVAIARCKSSVLGNICKSDDTPTKTKSAIKVESASRLNEKLQPQKYHAVSVVRRSNRNRKNKHRDEHALPLRTLDTLEKACSLDNNLVECQVRLCEGVLEVGDDGKTQAGICVKKAFANEGTLDENSTCAGDFVIEDADLIDVLIVDQQNTFPSQMKLENTHIIPVDCIISESTEASHRPDPNRTIIHTFSRKRKNGSLVQLGETNSSGECSLKKLCGEGNATVLISGKRNPGDESSGDCRQSLQVAH